MNKFILGCRFSFEAYAKNAREKARFHWMLMEICLPKGDQGKVAPIFLRDTQILDVLIFCQKKFCLMSGLKITLSGVKSFLLANLSSLKKKLDSGLLLNHKNEVVGFSTIVVIHFDKLNLRPIKSNLRDSSGKTVLFFYRTIFILV